MKKEDAADLAEKLKDGGFAILEAEQDTIALRRETKTFRKRIETGKEAA